MTGSATRGTDQEAARHAPASASSRARALLPTAVPATLLVAALRALAIFATLWIVRDLWALRDPSRAPTLSAPVEEERCRYGHAVAGLALFAVYGWLLPRIGFSIATAAFIAAWCRLGGIRRLRVVVPVMLIGTSAILWLFMGLALIPLPRGHGIFDAISVWLLRAVGIYQERRRWTHPVFWRGDSPPPSNRGRS